MQKLVIIVIDQQNVDITCGETPLIIIRPDITLIARIGDKIEDVVPCRSVSPMGVEVEEIGSISALACLV